MYLFYIETLDCWWRQSRACLAVRLQIDACADRPAAKCEGLISVLYATNQTITEPACKAVGNIAVNFPCLDLRSSPPWNATYVVATGVVDSARYVELLRRTITRRLARVCELLLSTNPNIGVAGASLSHVWIRR